MNPTDDLEKRIRCVRVVTGDALDERILADASARLESGTTTASEPDPEGPSVWRMVMRSNWIKLAAAVLFVAIGGTVMSLRQVVPAAYALEQTIEANLGLRYLHIRIEGSEPWREVWAEFGRDATLLRLRVATPKTEDGDKEFVWEDGKAEVWFKTKGTALTVPDRKAANQMAKEMTGYDPKLLMEKLRKAEADGRAEVETKEPSGDKQPVLLNVRYKDDPDRREVYRVNSETKFLEQLDRGRMVGGKFERAVRIEYLEYNQPIPEGTFKLDIPASTLRADWTTQEVGLAKGDLTDEEIAKKVAREFFEALIAKDYARAGKLFGGIPADRMEKVFAKLEFVRIVSIGEPEHPDHPSRSLRVPCEVEIRVGEETGIQHFRPFIRANEVQPGRWSISGGI